VSEYRIQPVGHIATPFKQKFAIPRQPNLAAAPGVITLAADYHDASLFKGFDGYSHLWLLFMFHQNLHRGWQPAVKAPRLGGNATMGVFATRSTHRPNGMGMSVVKNKGARRVDGKWVVNVEGVDLVDGTPIIDIKPYLPYADAVAEATDPLETYAPIPSRNVIWSEPARQSLARLLNRAPEAQSLIESILAQDPRPAYRHKVDDDDKTYRVALYNVDISWQVMQGAVHILAIEPAEG